MSPVNKLKLIEWAGSLTGLLGSAVVALNLPFSGYGFVGFLVSNVFWIAFGFKTRAWGLLTMQLGFMVTSTTGIYRWLWLT